MTRQTWTAFVAALAFVLAAVLLAVLSVPFVTWGPGEVINTLGKAKHKPVIRVRGTKTHATSGQLDLTTVSVTRADSRLSLPEALVSYWAPEHDTLPRDAVYPPGKSAKQATRENRIEMQTSQDQAKVAALREAGRPVHKRPAVSSVKKNSPAYHKLKPADLIMAINNHPVSGIDQAHRVIHATPSGSPVTFSISRQHKPRRIKVRRGAPGGKLGITIDQGYQFQPRISFRLGHDIGGPSAGLIFSLAIYDKLTAMDLLNGRRVAGTGTIDADGKVGTIGGIRQKLAAATKNRARYFLVPAGNCPDLAGVRTATRLIKVDTLHTAVSALRKLNTDRAARLPRCTG